MKIFLPTILAFLSGIASIWIKEWVVQKSTVTRKKNALRALYISELNEYPKYLRLLEQGNDGRCKIKYNIHMPEAIIELLSDLVRSDLSNADFYNKMIASQSIAKDLIEEIHNTSQTGKGTDVTILFSELRHLLKNIAHNQLVFVDRENLPNPTLNENSIDLIKGEMQET